MSALDKFRQYELWRHVLGRIVRSHKTERVFVAAALNAAGDPLRLIEMYVNKRNFSTISRFDVWKFDGKGMVEDDLRPFRATACVRPGQHRA